MTQFLPPNLLALFAARDPIPYLPPVDKLPHEKQTTGYTGVAAFVKEFEDPKDTPPPVRIETREEKREAKRKAKAEQVAYKLEQDIALWNPSNNPSSTSDPFKTLFVARINYDTSESKLRREFEMYGPIRKIVIVHERQTGKPRGYAFIEYEHVRDMHSAFKHADGRKIDGRRVLVDVEKGRSIKGWLPRRLGGGLGGTRRGGPDVNLKHSGREESRLEERYIDRDRDRAAPDRERARSRDRRRRSRSRSRDRHRSDRHKRDRSRDRERNRDRDASAASVKPDVDGDAAETKPEVESSSRKDRERRRSRSRDRDRKRRRSRSRDRKRRDYDRRDRESRRERNAEAEEKPKEVAIKQEPNPDSFNNTGYEGEFNNNNYSNNNSMEPTSYEAY